MTTYFFRCLLKHFINFYFVGLISERSGQEQYGTISQSQEKPSIERTFSSATASTNFATDFTVEEEKASTSDVVKKILIILVFFGIVAVGVVVRLATQDLIAQYRMQSPTETTTAVWNATDFSQTTMNYSFPQVFTLAN